jgi:hypothetical protein
MRRTDDAATAGWVEGATWTTERGCERRIDLMAPAGALGTTGSVGAASYLSPAVTGAPEPATPRDQSGETRCRCTSVAVCGARRGIQNPIRCRSRPTTGAPPVGPSGGSATLIDCAE